jgi:hypothetical protein
MDEAKHFTTVTFDTSFKLADPSYNIPTSKELPGPLKFTVDELGETVFATLDPSLQLAPFKTSEELHMAFRNLFTTWWNRYWRVFIKPARTPDNYDPRLDVPEKFGIAPDYFDKLNQQLRSQLRAIPAYRNAYDPTGRVYQGPGMRRIVRENLQWQSIREDNMFEAFERVLPNLSVSYRAMCAYYGSFARLLSNFARPITNPFLYDDMDFIPAPSGAPLFQYLLRSPALVKKWVDMVYTITGTVTRVPELKQNQVQDQIMNILEVRANQFTIIRALPSKLTPGAAQSMIRLLTTVLLTGGESAFDMTLDMKFDLVALLSCIAVKLMLPGRALLSSTRIAIMKYLHNFLWVPLTNSLEKRVVVGNQMWNDQEVNAPFSFKVNPTWVVARQRGGRPAPAPNPANAELDPVSISLIQFIMTWMDGTFPSDFSQDGITGVLVDRFVQNFDPIVRDWPVPEGPFAGAQGQRTPVTALEMQGVRIRHMNGRNDAFHTTLSYQDFVPPGLMTGQAAAPLPAMFQLFKQFAYMNIDTGARMIYPGQRTGQAVMNMMRHLSTQDAEMSSYMFYMDLFLQILAHHPMTRDTGKPGVAAMNVVPSVVIPLLQNEPLSALLGVQWAEFYITDSIEPAVTQGFKSLGKVFDIIPRSYSMMFADGQLREYLRRDIKKKHRWMWILDVESDLIKQIKELIINSEFDYQALPAVMADGTASGPPIIADVIWRGNYDYIDYFVGQLSLVMSTFPDALYGFTSQITLRPDRPTVNTPTLAFSTAVPARAIIGDLRTILDSYASNNPTTFANRDSGFEQVYAPIKFEVVADAASQTRNGPEVLEHIYKNLVCPALTVRIRFQSRLRDYTMDQLTFNDYATCPNVPLSTWVGVTQPQTQALFQHNDYNVLVYFEFMDYPKVAPRS